MRTGSGVIGDGVCRRGLSLSRYYTRRPRRCADTLDLHRDQKYGDKERMALEGADILSVRPRRYAVAGLLRRDLNQRAAINSFQTKLEIMSRPRRGARV